MLEKWFYTVAAIETYRMALFALESEALSHLRRAGNVLPARWGTPGPDRGRSDCTFPCCRSAWRSNGRGGDREKWIIKLQLYRPSSCVLLVVGGPSPHKSSPQILYVGTCAIYSWNYDNWVAVTEWPLLAETRPERFKRKPGGFKACPRTNYPNARGPHFSQ